MKRPWVAAAGFLTCVLLFLQAEAATKQWTYSVSSNIVLQIRTDGKGGCTLLTTDMDLTNEVVWLDKAGNVVLTMGVSNALGGGGVASCTPTRLIVGDEVDGGKVVLVVDAKGGKTLVPAAAGTSNTVYTFLPFPVDRSADAKGFFAVETDTNTTMATVVRYTYK